MIRNALLLVLLFALSPLYAISLAVSGGGTPNEPIGVAVSGELSAGESVQLLAMPAKKPAVVVDRFTRLPQHILFTNTRTNCYFVRFTDRNGTVVDYAPVCLQKTPPIRYHYAGLLLMIVIIGGIIRLLFAYFYRPFSLSRAETVFENTVRNLYLTTVEQGGQMSLSVGGGIGTGFQNIGGFMLFNEFGRVIDSIGGVLPLYTSDPLLYQMALSVDHAAFNNEVIFLGGNEAAFMVLVNREVSTASQSNMLSCAGEWSGRALLATVPLAESGVSIVAISSYAEALAPVLTSLSLPGFGADLFSLLSFFRRQKIRLVFQLLIALLVLALWSVIILFLLSLFFGDVSWLSWLSDFQGGGI